MAQSAKFVMPNVMQFSFMNLPVLLNFPNSKIK